MAGRRPDEDKLRELQLRLISTLKRQKATAMPAATAPRKSAAPMPPRATC